MKTSIDSNIISALLQNEDSSQAISELIWQQRQKGTLLMFGVVYAELSAQFSQDILLDLFETLDIQIIESLPKKMWLEAGLAFKKYRLKRKKSKQPEPKRFLADFIIGIHALHDADCLLTLDGSIYRTFFPTLRLIEP
jgi:predicted nucleic acid-binding protein